MPNIGWGNYFAHGSFPEVGRRERKKEIRGRTMVITIANTWRTQAAWANCEYKPECFSERLLPVLVLVFVACCTCATKTLTLT